MAPYHCRNPFTTLDTKGIHATGAPRLPGIENVHFLKSPPHTSLEHFFPPYAPMVESKGSSCLPHSSSFFLILPPGTHPMSLGNFFHTRNRGHVPCPVNLAWSCDFLWSVNVAESVCKSEPEPRIMGGFFCSSRDSEPQGDVAQLGCWKNGTWQEQVEELT